MKTGGRNKSIGVKFNDEEMKKLEDLKEMFGLSISNTIRKLVNDRADGKVLNTCVYAVESTRDDLYELDRISRISGLTRGEMISDLVREKAACIDKEDDESWEHRYIDPDDYEENDEY